MRHFFLAVSLAALSACNSGDTGEDLFVSGVWNGGATLNENSCPLPNQPATITYTHTVNQNEEAVTLQDQNGNQFLGNILSDQGFSVDNPGPQDQQIGNLVCDFTNRVEYDGIFQDEDTDADVTVSVIRTCSDNSECKAEYRGRATRNLPPVV
jgi:hypothetical protein